jgi:hypothetical protein
MPRIPLPPITDFEAYDKNTKDQYEALGRFIVAFEAMVNETRDACINLLDRDAPHGRLADIAFHHPALTAKPLFEIMRALIVEILKLPHVALAIKDQDTFRGVLGTIAGEYFELSNIRNSLVHGTWHIGYSTEEDPNAEHFFLFKFKPTKSGLEKEDVPKHAFELLALKDRCEKTRNWISHIHFCVPRSDRPYDRIDERFLFKNGNWQFTFGPDTPPETLP